MAEEQPVPTIIKPKRRNFWEIFGQGWPNSGFGRPADLENATRTSSTQIRQTITFDVKKNIN